MGEPQGVGDGIGGHHGLCAGSINRCCIFCGADIRCGEFSLRVFLDAAGAGVSPVFVDISAIARLQLDDGDIVACKHGPLTEALMDSRHS